MSTACVSGAKRSIDDVDAGEDAVSAALALAAAKRRALEEFKQAALARLLGGSDGDDSDSGVGKTEETPNVADDSAEVADVDETSPVALTAEAIQMVEEWDPATGLIVSTPMNIEALKAEVTDSLKAEGIDPPDNSAGDRSREADNEDEDQEEELPVDFSIGDFLRKQSESVVGQFLSSGSTASTSSVGVVASAAPVFERRDPTALRRPGQAHAITKHIPSEEVKAEPLISGTGKVVGRETAKSVSGGFCSYGRGDASTGVEFNRNAQRKELERKQRDQELRERFRQAEEQLRDQKSQKQQLQQQPLQASTKPFAKVYARGQAPTRMPQAPLDEQQWDAPALPDWQKQPAVRPVTAPKFKAAPKAGMFLAPRSVGMQTAPKAAGIQTAPKASTAFLRSGAGW